MQGREEAHPDDDNSKEDDDNAIEEPGEKDTIETSGASLSQSQLNAKFFDFLYENRLIFVGLSGRFQILKRDFGVFF